MRHSPCLALLLAGFFAGAAGFAQSSSGPAVHWDPAGGSIPVGQTVSLKLVFENCSPKESPPAALPKPPDLSLEFVGNSSNTIIINGTQFGSEVLNFAAALTREHPVDLPAFTVETSKGPQRVPAVHFEPTAATIGRSGPALSDVAAAKMAVKSTTVWAGEVFDLTATIEAARSYYPNFTRGFEWTPDPLLTESWSDPQQFDATANNEAQVGFAYRTRALVRNPGHINLNTARHSITLTVAMAGLGFFQQRQTEQYVVQSAPLALEVKPLPPAPAGFSGAVGEFKLTGKVVPETAAVGEPITWTLDLSGTGNWPDIAGLPPREVSTDFRAVQPKGKRTPADGKIFDATLSEDVVLVPTKAGSYALGPIAFVYFDPKSGSYKTLTVPRTTVAISGPATPPVAANNAGNPMPAAGNGADAGGTRASPPPPPAGIPRDPLPGAATVRAPMARFALLEAVLAAVIWLPFFWFALAWRRARATDPLRAPREAHARIGSTLAQLARGDSAQRSALLLAWQQDAAILWRVSHAAPPASALADAAWAALWTEADQALYGAKLALPSDWIARAEAAWAMKQPPGFQPWRLFLPQNLFPFAALLVLAGAALTLRAAATGATADPLAAYRAGDFASAEKVWREAAAAHPTDWIARHNLSLALAQLDRAPEAAAQAAAAFVQAPAEPAAHWHFVFASDAAGVAPGSLAGFLSPGPAQSLARLASPATWQRTLIAAVLAAAVAVAALLVGLYTRRSRFRQWTIVGGFGVCLGLAGAAVGSLETYGLAADNRAVVIARPGLLRSIPTEADTTQKTTALAPGSMAIADKTFLGWTRLNFENGQTGWVRQEQIVGLWR